MVTTGTVL